METKVENLILSLKSVKIHPDMSDETNCFSANIYVNGQKVGRVSNDGQGGGNMYSWKGGGICEKVETWAKAQETRYKFDKLDQIIDDLLMKWEETRYLKKACKTQTLFRLKGDKRDQWRILVGTWSQKAMNYINNKYGDQVERIANQEINPLT